MPSYLAFVAIGIVVNLAAGVLLYRVANALRQEQLHGHARGAAGHTDLGRHAAVRLGRLRPDPVPIRAALLLGAIALVFGLDLELAGVVPALALLLCFCPSSGASG